MDAFPGLAALIDGLRRMPTAIEQDAAVLVDQAGQTMAAELAGEYPSVSGDLQRGIRVVRENAFRVTVKSTSKHAFIYERGTVERFHASGKSVGAMPRANVFI